MRLQLHVRLCRLLVSLRLLHLHLQLALGLLGALLRLDHRRVGLRWLACRLFLRLENILFRFLNRILERAANLEPAHHKFHRLEHHRRQFGCRLRHGQGGLHKRAQCVDKLNPGLLFALRILEHGGIRLNIHVVGTQLVVPHNAEHFVPGRLSGGVNKVWRDFLPLLRHRLRLHTEPRVGTLNARHALKDVRLVVFRDNLRRNAD